MIRYILFSVLAIEISAFDQMPSEESIANMQKILEKEYKHINHTKIYSIADMKKRQAEYDGSKRSKWWRWFFGVDTHKKELIEICSTGIDRLFAGPTSKESLDDDIYAAKETWAWIGWRYIDWSFTGQFWTFPGCDSALWTFFAKP